jgi:hypothetical protein
MEPEMKRNQPCPVCGGNDRFYLIERPRNGGDPYWRCRHCNHTRPDGDDPVVREAQRRERTPLTEEQTRQAWEAYTAAAEWYVNHLWSGAPDANAALEYLRGRGLSDTTIRRARLGFHPDTPDKGVGLALFNSNPALAEGLQLGGLSSEHHVTFRGLRGALTFPYFDSTGVCRMIRMRKLQQQEGGPKYLSPAGPMYAGGTPSLYLLDQLGDARRVLLTEGEFKALVPLHHGIAAVAQPGIGFLPTAFIHQLEGKEVIICYDTEARSDPFYLSPGERFTLRSVQKLTVIGAQEQLEKLQAIAKKANGDSSQMYAQIEQLKHDIELLQALQISVKVLRLPRKPDQHKVDIDEFIQQHGIEQFQKLMEKAKPADQWYAAHSGAGFRFENGGMYNSIPVANYQAIITETVGLYDGQAVDTVQRVALRTPEGRQHTIDISAEDWADDRNARQKIRAGLGDGTFDDNPRDVLRCIRMLSRQGDPPVYRQSYTATGWEQIDGHWHYLVSDGAINAQGTTVAVSAEIDAQAQGNHYEMCGAGDAQTGAAAWLAFLRGEVCPQPLALILAGQAALAPVHRWIGDGDRAAAWLYNESGSLKMALTRAGVMALWGPRFTAERGGGAPVAKWDATSAGLGGVVFYFRDAAVLIDDYKQGVIHPEAFKRFLHNYSEGTGRTRMTAKKRIDRVLPARCIIFATAEDIPTGDPGIQARLLSFELQQGSVDTERLAQLQRAGADGHLAAFWGSYLAALAGALDGKGEAGLRETIQKLLRQDDAQLPGHKRSAGALRQNRAAFLLLTTWLYRAGHITAEECHTLNDAHLSARSRLAEVQQSRQTENRPATIFLSVLRELLDSGELIIEKPDMSCPKCSGELYPTNDGWYCHGGDKDNPCSYHIPTSRIIGFMHQEGVGIYPEKAFREVSRIRNDQRQPFAYTANAIWQQLANDGALHRSSQRRIITQKRNPARRLEDGSSKPARVLFFQRGVIESDSEYENRDHTCENVGSRDQWDQYPVLGEGDTKCQNTQKCDSGDHQRDQQNLLIPLSHACTDSGISNTSHSNAPRTTTDPTDPADPTFYMYDHNSGNPAHVDNLPEDNRAWIIRQIKDAWQSERDMGGKALAHEYASDLESMPGMELTRLLRKVQSRIKKLKDKQPGG